MDDAAAFSATYEDWKLVKSRGVVQIIFEAPVEKDNEILRVLGGMPRVAKGQWFAIARLNVEGAEAKKPSTHNTDSLETTSEKAAARRLTQRAAISCNAPIFRVFLERQRGGSINDYDEAHNVVCAWLDIESLRELDRDDAAAARWEELWAKYLTWKTAARYVEAT